MVVLFARIGQGKSWILNKMLAHSWQIGYNVGLISPEMSAVKIGYRFDTLVNHFSNKNLVWRTKSNWLRGIYKRFKRQEKSYTFVTIKELYKQLILTEKPYFIIGDDAFVQIETWYHTEELKELINFIVLPRDNDFDKDIFDKLSQKGYNYIRLDEMPKIDISSTEIRKRASQGKSLAEYTTAEVEQYIYDNNLYQNVG